MEENTVPETQESAEPAVVQLTLKKQNGYLSLIAASACFCAVAILFFTFRATESPMAVRISLTYSAPYQAGLFALLFGWLMLFFAGAVYYSIREKDTTGINTSFSRKYVFWFATLSVLFWTAPLPFIEHIILKGIVINGTIAISAIMLFIAVTMLNYKLLELSKICPEINSHAYMGIFWLQVISILLVVITFNAVIQENIVLDNRTLQLLSRLGIFSMFLLYTGFLAGNNVLIKNPAFNISSFLLNLAMVLDISHYISKQHSLIFEITALIIYLASLLVYAGYFFVSKQKSVSARFLKISCVWALPWIFLSFINEDGAFANSYPDLFFIAFAVNLFLGFSIPAVGTETRTDPRAINSIYLILNSLFIAGIAIGSIPSVYLTISMTVLCLFLLIILTTYNVALFFRLKGEENA